jgi:hypothetical protein
MDLSRTPNMWRGWTPIRIEWDGSQPPVDWCFSDGIEFTDPSFDATVRRCFRNPARLLFRRRTTMAQLAELAVLDPGLVPSGLIFHASRCGSTLVAQMLGAIPSVHMMAEPGPLDSVLGARRADRTLAESDHQSWLRDMVSVLGRPARPEQRHYVLKLDAWAIIDLPFLLRAFSGIPWIFLYRDPIEVLASHMGHRGFHMIPGCLSDEQLGDAGDRVTTFPAEEFCAAVLARLFQCALEGARDDGSRLVNYSQLPEAVIDRIAPMFGIEVGASDRAAVEEVARRDAKNPVLNFKEDGPDKRKRASDDLRAAATRWAYPSYEALDSVRRMSS